MNKKNMIEKHLAKKLALGMQKLRESGRTKLNCQVQVGARIAGVNRDCGPEVLSSFYVLNFP